MPLARKYRLGARPIVVWVFPDPSPFLLPDGNAVGALTIFNEQFSAISPNQPGMNYTIISGSLPFGLNFTNGFGANADFAFLNGQAQVGPPPVWISPPDGTLLASLGELEDITPRNISLNAGPTPPGSSIRYFVQFGGLPLGLLLDGNTGDITGIAAPLIGQFPPVSNLNPPVWNSPADGSSLGQVPEVSAVSITGWPNVTFTGTISSYYVIEGRLPLGLVMDRSTGDITGTTSTVSSGPGLPPVAPPSIASRGWARNVGDTVNFDLNPQVTVVAPKTVSRFYVISGSIPTGTALDPITGIISGTITEAGLFEAEIVVVDSDDEVDSATFNFNIS